MNLQQAFCELKFENAILRAKGRYVLRFLREVDGVYVVEF